MSRPSSQTTGSSPGLPWSWNVHDGVMMKSPGCIVDALAVDRGIGALALDHEAQRRLRVAMAGRDLAGQDELQPRVERVRDRRGAAQARILEHEHAALRFARA